MSITLVIIVVLMTLQVIMRYVFNHALSFPEEVCRYSFIWMTYIGLSYAVRTGGALKVDILSVAIPKLAKPLNVIGDLAYALLFIVLIVPGVKTIQMMASMKARSPAVGMPMWVIYVPLLLGCILGIVRTVQKYVAEIKGRGQTAAVEAPAGEEGKE